MEAVAWGAETLRRDSPAPDKLAVLSSKSAGPVSQSPVSDTFFRRKQRPSSMADNEAELQGVDLGEQGAEDMQDDAQAVRPEPDAALCARGGLRVP